MQMKYKNWFFFKKEHYLWSKFRFKLSPPNEDGVKFFSMIVHDNEDPQGTTAQVNVTSHRSKQFSRQCNHTHKLLTYT